MKTTLDISDELLLRAKRRAKKAGKPLRALVEEGIRRVLEESESRRSYRMPDCSVGRPGDPYPLEDRSWEDVRDEVYRGRGT